MNCFKNLAARAANKAAYIGGSALAVGVVASEKIASATPPPLVDWAAQATELKDEASPAIAAAIGVGVAFLAVAIGYKLLRRFAK